MKMKINRQRKALISLYCLPNLLSRMRLHLKHLLILFLFISILFTILHLRSQSSTSINTASIHNILFCIASDSSSFTNRISYLRSWYNPNSTRAIIFIDKYPQISSLLPPIVVSGETSRFPYTFRQGRRSAIRIARMVKEAFDRGESDVNWFVFGDDDTVFFPENLAAVLSKYDHNQWYYIGSRSESLEQNAKLSFDMAYGGGGFAISSSLARVLSRVLDSCLMRYPHLYGSDSRVFVCLTELGVAMTVELGFHQFDVRGSLLGLLTAHPLSPLLSLHHLDAVEPLFPSMNKTESLEHLFEATNVDSQRILQQTVCYSHTYNLSVSVSWGYAVQIYEGNHFINDLISPLRTFKPWRRGAQSNKKEFVIDTRDYPQDPCKKPALFFFENVETTDDENIWSIYVKKYLYDCYHTNTILRLRDVRISSTKLEVDRRSSSRRQCCDIVHPFDTSMFIHLRSCGEEELISMDP